MQWYEHTRPALMQLLLADALGAPVYQDERDGVQRERYRCVGCGEESVWAFYDPRHPIAGCNHDDCGVEARMGLFDVLTYVWNDEAWGELPENRSERSRRLGQKLGEISQYHMGEEEAERGQAFQEEHQGRKQAEDSAAKWKNNAGQWKGKAEQLEIRVEEVNNAYDELEEKLHSAIDRRALTRGISWGLASLFSAGMFFLLLLRRAGAEMVSDWGSPLMALYLLSVSAACSYFVFSSVYQDALKAKQRHRLPRPLYERIDWQVGVAWLKKVVACLVVPYIVIGFAGDLVDRLGPLSQMLPRDGIEWLLICTAVGAACVILLGALMSEDLEP